MQDEPVSVSLVLRFLCLCACLLSMSAQQDIHSTGSALVGSG